MDDGCDSMNFGEHDLSHEHAWLIVGLESRFVQP